jgi:hypothetical protein
MVVTPMGGAAEVKDVPVWHVKIDFQKINVFANESFVIRG